MQTLEIIGGNLWNILISLANLVLIYLIVKKFLFGPVKKLIAERQATIDAQYAAAAEAERAALDSRAEWEEKRAGAKAEADAIVKNATELAERRAAQIVESADQKAAGILRRAESEAELERKKATEGIKREIVDVSAALAEKMLEREINEDDHRVLIDSFIEKIGDEYGGDQ
ncbi:MAG: F0F1 ATP synthase subunit B [Clostridia bacterium]|nr:F0F1 ATP synthase subunit B [Clostridia bacterium]